MSFVKMDGGHGRIGPLDPPMLALAELAGRSSSSKIVTESAELIL